MTDKTALPSQFEPIRKHLSNPSNSQEASSSFNPKLSTGFYCPACARLKLEGSHDQSKCFHSIPSSPTQFEIEIDNSQKDAFPYQLNGQSSMSNTLKRPLEVDNPSLSPVSLLTPELVSPGSVGMNMLAGSCDSGYTPSANRADHLSVSQGASMDARNYCDEQISSIYSPGPYTFGYQMASQSQSRFPNRARFPQERPSVSDSAFGGDSEPLAIENTKGEHSENEVFISISSQLSPAQHPKAYHVVSSTPEKDHSISKFGEQLPSNWERATSNMNTSWINTSENLSFASGSCKRDTQDQVNSALCTLSLEEHSEGNSNDSQRPQGSPNSSTNPLDIPIKKKRPQNLVSHSQPNGPTSFSLRTQSPISPGNPALNYASRRRSSVLSTKIPLAGLSASVESNTSGGLPEVLERHLERQEPSSPQGERNENKEQGVTLRRRSQLLEDRFLRRLSNVSLAESLLVLSDGLEQDHSNSPGAPSYLRSRAPSRASIRSMRSHASSPRDLAEIQELDYQERDHIFKSSPHVPGGHHSITPIPQALERFGPLLQDSPSAHSDRGFFASEQTPTLAQSASRCFTSDQLSSIHERETKVHSRKAAFLSCAPPTIDSTTRQAAAASFSAPKQAPESRAPSRNSFTSFFSNLFSHFKEALGESSSRSQSPGPVLASALPPSPAPAPREHSLEAGAQNANYSQATSTHKSISGPRLKPFAQRAELEEATNSAYATPEPVPVEDRHLFQPSYALTGGPNSPVLIPSPLPARSSVPPVPPHRNSAATLDRHLQQQANVKANNQNPNATLVRTLSSSIQSPRPIPIQSSSPAVPLVTTLPSATGPIPAIASRTSLSGQGFVRVHATDGRNLNIQKPAVADLPDVHRSSDRLIYSHCMGPFPLADGHGQQQGQPQGEQTCHHAVADAPDRSSSLATDEYLCTHL